VRNVVGIQRCRQAHYHDQQEQAKRRQSDAVAPKAAGSQRPRTAAGYGRPHIRGRLRLLNYSSHELASCCNPVA
jgi:hypothetical protein